MSKEPLATTLKKISKRLTRDEDETSENDTDDEIIDKNEETSFSDVQSTVSSCINMIPKKQVSNIAYAYTEDETATLCELYIEFKKGPKLHSLWESIAEKFNDRIGSQPQNRSSKALSTKWRAIHKSLSRFFNLYVLKSGESDFRKINFNDADIYDKALLEYMKKSGKFEWKHCFDIFIKDPNDIIITKMIDNGVLTFMRNNPKESSSSSSSPSIIYERSDLDDVPELSHEEKPSKKQRVISKVEDEYDIKDLLLQLVESNEKVIQSNREMIEFMKQQNQSIYPDMIKLLISRSNKSE